MTSESVSKAPLAMGYLISVLDKNGDNVTLRDYFAAHALTNLRMNEPAYDWQKLAEQAYRYADAMLKERAK